jgi:hypothetical protein
MAYGTQASAGRLAQRALRGGPKVRPLQRLGGRPPSQRRNAGLGDLSDPCANLILPPRTASLPGARGVPDRRTPGRQSGREARLPRTWIPEATGPDPGNVLSARSKRVAERNGYGPAPNPRVTTAHIYLVCGREYLDDLCSALKERT